MWNPPFRDLRVQIMTCRFVSNTSDLLDHETTNCLMSGINADSYMNSNGYLACDVDGRLVATSLQGCVTIVYRA
jgi:hypothetical protein